MKLKEILSILIFVIGVGIYIWHSQTGIQFGGQNLGEQTVTTSAPDAKCHYNGPLPDNNCTPGAANPDITQNNIAQTICNSSWTTKSIRPSSAYTNQLKIQQLVEYGSTDQNTANFEEDHLIPLEVGGGPSDPKNLWPEPRKGTPNASNKDKLENYLHAQVCSGAVSLSEAQKEFTADWVKYWRMAGSP